VGFLYLIEFGISCPKRTHPKEKNNAVNINFVIFMLRNFNLNL